MATKLFLILREWNSYEVQIGLLNNGTEYTRETYNKVYMEECWKELHSKQLYKGEWLKNNKSAWTIKDIKCSSKKINK